MNTTVNNSYISASNLVVHSCTCISLDTQVIGVTCNYLHQSGVSKSDSVHILC